LYASALSIIAEAPVGAWGRDRHPCGVERSLTAWRRPRGLRAGVSISRRLCDCRSSSWSAIGRSLWTRHSERTHAGREERTPRRRV